MAVVWVLVSLAAAGALRVSANVCYEHSCLGAGCLENAIAAGTARTCPRTDLGCTVMVIKDREVAACVTMACNDLYTSSYTQHCCATDRCNSNTKPVKKPGDNCYSVACDTKGCVAAAVAAGKAAYCAKSTGRDCQFTITKSGDVGFHKYKETSKCSTTECESLTTRSANDNYSQRTCCPTPLCNDGKGLAVADGDQCYSMICAAGGEDCIKTAPSIGLTPGLCKMDPNYGCFISVQALGSDPSAVTVQAGCNSADKGCAKESVGQVRKLCCGSDRCNDDLATDPTEDKCYVAECSGDGQACSSTDFDISTVSTFCNAGQGGGCTYQMAYRKGETHVSTGCVNEDGCQSYARYSNRFSFELRRCCHGDNCNTGPRAGNTGKDQCYETMCQGSDCLKDAVKVEAYLLCPMSEHGCVTSSGETEIGNTTVLVTKSACAQTACVVGQTTEPGFKTVACCSEHTCIGDVTSGGNMIAAISANLIWVLFGMFVLSVS